MSVDEILASLRPDEIVDAAQIEELKRWRLLDFEPEPPEAYTSPTPLATVCGCGRSGTTLARVILDSHSQVYGGPESLVFLPVPIRIPDLASKFEVDEARLEELLAKSRSRAEFVDDFQRLLLELNRKSIWVDKTARNVHRLEYILSHFPNARIIHVVRDPRDVVASLKTHRRHRVEDGKIVPTGYCMPVDLCIDRCRLALSDGLKHRGAAYYHEVRYEDLVVDTERTVRGICDFLGITFEEGMLDFHRQKSSTREYLKFPQNVEATRPIFSSSVGRHRTGLTAEEIVMVEDSLGDCMEAMGYPPSPRAAARAMLPPPLDSAPGLKVLTAGDVHAAIGGDPLKVKEWTREALRLHYEGRFLQPQKTYLVTDSLYDRIIALPAAVFGEKPALGIKWIGSHSGNYARGLERANALIVLNDPTTHAASVVMDGTLISSLRTLAISLIAMDRFAPRPRSVGILGMGKLGRMHAQLLPDLYPSIENVRCFSSRAPYDDLLADDRIRKESSPEAVVARSEVVVTASAATEPYIREEHVSRDCRLIVNLSLMDCDVDVICNSAHIIVDDWSQNIRAERVFKSGVDRGLYGRDRVVELGAVLFGPRKNYPGRVFVNPLGMGLEDIYVAGKIARHIGLYP